MMVSSHLLVTGTPPNQCSWQSNPKEAWQQGGSREVGCLLILQNADDNTSPKGASKWPSRKDFTWNPARRREVPRTSFFFSGIAARHLTFEILRPGSTLILAKICSSSSPPWFSSLLVTTSEDTRKYSQVSAKTLTFSVISDEHAGHALTNIHSTTLSSLQELAFPTFLCQSSLLTCVDDISAKTILIIR